jgi:hypothetical protein
MATSRQSRLDIDLGDELRGWLVAEARTSGVSAGALARELLISGRLQHRALADAVRGTVLALAAATVNDGSTDPADDERYVRPLNQLASLLGSAPAALGVLEALRELDNS